ncbi:enoyl-CoA hydratase/isomerase family protein [Saccharopolyspora tripterygii]
MLDLEHRSAAALVRLRSAARRTLTADVLDGLAEAIVYIGPQRPIVLTGAHRDFAPDLDPTAGPERDAALKPLADVLDALRAHPLPVVAAINGDALGAGYALAEAADVRIMSAGTVRPSSWRGTGCRAAAALELGLVDRRCSRADLIRLALHEAGALRRHPALPG